LQASHQDSSTLSELLVLAAVAAPVLMAYSQTPTVTFYNQVLALVGWGAWAVWLGLSGGLARWRGAGAGAWSLVAALGVVLAVQAATPWRSGAPWGLTLQAMGLTSAAVLAAVLGARAARGPQSDAVVAAFCWALAVAGGASVVLALIQVFLPALADGIRIASPSVAGRAVGNLRQPNHLSTLLLMAAAAVVWLSARPRHHGAWPVPAAAALLTALTWAVVATGSRTGMLGIVMLTLWGVLDRELPAGLRRILWSLPVVYVLCWLGMAGWAHATGQDFIGESRLHTGSDISSSRFGIWSNTLSLIGWNALGGVGWGGFNFAWTLTAFPGRPVAFFDHTHNLALQMLVELGLPLGVGVLLLLLLAYWALLLQSTRRSLGPTPRLALYIVTLLLVHSQLEYPLWYAYFLLPTAFVWGLGLGGRPTASFGFSADAAPAYGVAFAGVLVALGAGYAVGDYRKVTEIYAPSAGNTQTLEQRIALGQTSLLFAYQADYAEATTADHPGAADTYKAFRGATHNLLDARLMVAWARAEAERGEMEKARFLAHRVAEFRHPLGREFLAPCLASPASAAEHFQCGADTPLDFQAFLPP
jgi:Virulence factor membrane-bound polymerase, C-terminal/O-Antigen ligase/Protein glycosylation ligase